MSLIANSRTLVRQTLRYASTNIINRVEVPTIFEILSEISRQGFTLGIPRIVCIGNQSAGKTSLTEAMCGVNGLFPVKSAMATKRPTYIYLNRISDGEDYVKIGSLGEKISNIAKARQRLDEENSGDITDKPLDVGIYSTQITKECMLVDLPGFISVTRDGEDATLPNKIKKLCAPYIEDQSNIKMIVLSVATSSLKLDIS